MSENAREAILAAAKSAAQLHGYSGINFRSIAEEVGIKNASIYYHFPSKADLGAAVAQRYWQDTQGMLEDIRAAHPDPHRCLQLYPSIFLKSLRDGNRLCLSSFMAAEHEDLPDKVSKEVKAFVEVNVKWLAAVLMEAGCSDARDSEHQALAIYTAVAGAQLVARTCADTQLFDQLMLTYRKAGLIPG
ncbi:TetR/AcrR family transcriptional regulator [Pseudomonas syringae]|nr:TetR/AcrR family transcriptional regulator [Pseudomonas syringae]MBD8791071.1 TetR/AcrR family transcriptional regulator [Pseudomonas syringae]MBD8801317.1 TetR/AcrR family transcriptional regulator [Pseudomonas syringae]MBD8810406.1 TetR/AcrR family transcriptional regulator [Pseudomonas syringae]